MSEAATGAQVRPQVEREVRREATEFTHVFMVLQAELADLRRLLKVAAPVNSDERRK